MAGSTTYQYILSLQDKMSGVLRSVGAAGSSTFQRMQAQQAALQNSTQKTGGMLGGLAGTIAKLGLGFSAFQLGKKIFNAGADIEQTRVAFEVLLGSVEKGNALILKIRDYAVASPYESKALQANAKMMLGYNIAGDKVMGTMKMLGDIAMGNEEKMSSLTLAYSQAMSAGKLNGQDLLQMISAGYNPLSQMAADMSKQTGMSQANAMLSLRKQMEAGKISAAMLEAAFKKATSQGGRFYQMAEKQGRTLNGRFSTLKDNIGIIFTDLGEKANNGFSRAVEKLITMTEYVRAHMTEIIAALTKVFKAVYSIFRGAYDSLNWFFSALNRGNPIIIGFTAILVGATVALAAFKIYSLGVIAIIKIATAVQAAYNAVMAMNPIYLIIAAIVALIAAIAFVIYKTDGWGKTWSNTMDYIKLTFNQAGAWLELKWLQISDTFMSGFELIQKGWYKLQSLWDSDAANKGLSTLQDQSNARAEAILAAKNKVDAMAGARKQMKVMELTWNNKTLKDLVTGMKENLGLPGTTAAAGSGMAGAGSTLGGTDATISDLGTGIADGGNRPTNITINLKSLVESLNITSQNLKEGANEIESQVREALLRVLNSANGVAYGK